VAVSGNIAVIGSPYEQISSNQSQGAVYVLGKPVSGWQNAKQVAKLTASDGASFGYFGFSVSISGDTIAVGASNADGKGAVYVYQKPRTGWTTVTETAN
jgi:hypothetical protein